MKKFKLFPLILIICLALSYAAPSALALDEPALNAKAAVLVDADSGRVLFEKNMNEQRSMASLTKIMTVLMAVEAVEQGQVSMEETVTAQDNCKQGMDEESSTAGIVPGEQMSFENLLYCAMITSGNDACNVIASRLDGSIDAFVSRMNQRAAELGCTQTVFADPNGLSSDNKTCAYDLYLITREAMSHPAFAVICNTTECVIPATNMNPERKYSNSNALISSTSIYGGNRYLYEGAAGVKTGYTRAAGYCLVSTAARGEINAIAVVLGCDGWYNAQIEDYKNFEDSIALYDWTFDNFKHRPILTTADPLQKVDVELAKDEAKAVLCPQENVTLLLPTDLDSSNISTSVTLYEDKLVAPIEAGTVLGEAQIIIDGENYGSVKLVNSSEIELSRLELVKQKLKAFFSNGLVIAVLVVLLVVGGTFAVLVIRYRQLRRRYMKERRLREQRRRAEKERMYREMQLQQEQEEYPEEDFWK